MLLAVAARALCIVATSGAAVVVLLGYVPALAAPFSLPKEVAFELAGALAFAGFALDRALGGRPRAGGAGPSGIGNGGPGVSRPVVLGAALVLGSLIVSAAVAARSPTGAPYAPGVLGRWAALFGLACGAAVVARTSTSRIGLLHAVATAAALVSAIGLWQHVVLSTLPIPVISAPGSTFGNRNLGGEAVALSIPFGLGALFLARRPRERAALIVALLLEFGYLAATRTRGAWIGGAAGVLTVAILDRRFRSRPVVLAVLGIGALAAIVALVPGRANPRFGPDPKRFASGVEVVENTFDRTSPALRTRFGLWRRSLAMFRTAPIVGIGPGNWAVMFPRVAEPGATTDGVLSPTLAPHHAHNDAIECLTETGALGFGALLALAIGVVVTIRTQLRDADAAADADRRASTAAAAGTLVALVGVGVTGFPLSMPATLALSGLALGLISSSRVAAGSSGQERLRSGRVVSAVVVAGVFLAIAVLGGERRVRASAWLRVAEHALHADPGVTGASAAMHALDKAEAANPGVFRVALVRAHAALRLHRPLDSARAAEAALVQEPFSPNAWGALAEAQLDAGDAVSARKSAARALHLLNDYPDALFFEAQASQAVGDSITAAGAWARLATLARAPGVDKAISLSAQARFRVREAASGAGASGAAP